MAPRRFDPDRDHWQGRTGTSAQVILYGDFTCPNCRQAFRSDPSLVGRSARKGTFIYRHRPGQSREPESGRAARAAEAAGKQGVFWDMSEALYAQEDFSLAGLEALANRLGLDMDAFRADMESEAVARVVREDHADAERTGVTVTPAIFLNGIHYHGPWDTNAILEAVSRPATMAISSAFREFFSWAAAGGMVLILATLAALLIANTGLHDAYHDILTADFALSLNGASLSLPLEAWINDGLMAVFFLLVGIEIKRELIEGELSDPASAALPLIAALGGMLVPALIYVGINFGTETQHGWGVPMATDIAFTIGLMAMLGSRTPPALKIFVSALAVADDLGAILVIALFYGEGFHLDAFLWGCAVLAVMLALNLSRVYSRAPYLFLGLVLWFFIHESGLHATLAGVLTAAMIPSRPRGSAMGIAAQTSALLEAGADGEPIRADLLGQLERAIDRLREPGYHVERGLQVWTNFLILPLFAFANTGIVLGGGGFDPARPEVLGVILGLAVGKPAGIAVFSLAAVWLGWARMPTGVSALQLLGAGCLAGVGFTMSIFIANAAFDGAALDGVKLSVLIASTLSALLGLAILWFAGRERTQDQSGLRATRSMSADMPR